jgi:hypothetical protein
MEALVLCFLEPGYDNNIGSSKIKEAFTNKLVVEQECEIKRVPLDPRVSEKIVMISQALHQVKRWSYCHS